jgi:hypothetical protein
VREAPTRPKRYPGSCAGAPLGDGSVGDPLTGHDGTVRAVAAGVLPDGTPAIISGGDGTVRVGQTADSTPVVPAGHLLLKPLPDRGTAHPVRVRRGHLPASLTGTIDVTVR